MSTAIKFITVLFFTLILFACENNKEENNNKPSAVADLIEYDLTDYGKPFSIWVPDTNPSQLTVIEQADGALQVLSGRNFGIDIYEQETELELKRDDLKHDEVNRFRNFIREDENGLLWESEITEPEYHFVINMRVNGTDYSFQDVPGNSYSREAIETMYESAKNIRAK